MFCQRSIEFSRQRSIESSYQRCIELIHPCSLDIFERFVQEGRTRDRGRESVSSPSLRTGQALFAHPALQLMGSTVRLRSSRCVIGSGAIGPLSELWSGLTVRPLSGSSALSPSRHLRSTLTHLAFRASLSCLGSVSEVIVDKLSSLMSVPVSIHLPASLRSSGRYSPSVREARSCGLSACLRYYGRSDSCPSAVLRSFS